MTWRRDRYVANPFERIRAATSGLRRQSTVNGTTTDFLLDGQNVVAEKQSSGISAVYLTGATGPLYRRDSSGDVHWYVFDGLGSVVGEQDEKGAPATCFTSNSYDVFGYVRGTKTGNSKHAFVGGLGHTTEPETGGLIYMRARYYDPAVGRFISEDPARSGRNWYAYCYNDPVCYRDQSGKDGELVGEAGVMAIDACMSAEEAMSATSVEAFGEDLVAEGASANPIGEASYSSRAGEVLEFYGEDVRQLAGAEWNYFKIATSDGAPGNFMKAWLRWNGKEFDAYLQCAQDLEGDAGFAGHDMPYLCN